MPEHESTARPPAGATTEGIEPGAPSDNTTMTAVLAHYADVGFDGNFVIDDDAGITCGRCGQRRRPSEYTTHSLRRIEGASDPADMAAIIAMICPACGAQGTVVVRFGPEASAADATVLSEINDSRAGPVLPFAAPPGESGESGSGEGS